jgi:hypothetical protein
MRLLLLARIIASVATAAVPLCSEGPLLAQSSMHVVRTGSRAMRVRDGHSRTDWWVDPSSQPDTYNVAFPLVGGAVTFVSDVDSITITVKPGEFRDFIVRLRDSINCVTRVSAIPTYPRPRIVNGDSLGVQVIPFTMRDNRIYVEGSINGSAPLQMQYDLGAGATNFSKRSRGKSEINWDATDVLVNSDGRNTVPSSTRNTIRIGALEWTAQRLVQTENMARYEDVIIGNSLFRDRVVEIDHDRQQLRVHAIAPVVPPPFTHHPLALDGGVRPLIEAELLVNGERITDWYLFDTGLTSALVLSARQNRDHNLASRLGAWFGFGARKLFRARGFRVAGIEMPTAMAQVETHSDVNRGLTHGLIGNAWLRRFNVVLDNRQGVMWLAPTREAQGAQGSR